MKKCNFIIVVFNLLIFISLFNNIANADIKKIYYEKFPADTLEKLKVEYEYKIVDSVEVMDGKYISYWDNGEKAQEGNYVDGKRQGNWITWHRNGQKMEQGKYKDDAMSGKWEAFFKSGQNEYDKNYLNGKAHGKWIFWYNNGQKSKEQQWKEGKKHGIWLAWHKNGQRQYEKHFSNDKAQGIWIFWLTSGLKHKEQEWKDDTLISEIIYAEEEKESPEQDTVSIEKTLDEKLLELKSLRSRDLISEEEYDSLRKEILEGAN